MNKQNTEKETYSSKYSRRVVIVFQSLSHGQLFETPWTVAHETPLSFTISWSLLKLMSIELVMPSNHLILCRPLFLLPSIFPSIRIFSHELVLHIRWPKYWSSASASALPKNTQDLFPLGLAGLISLQSKGLSRRLLRPQFKGINSLACTHDEVYIMTHRYMQYYLHLKFTHWGIKNACYMYIL